MIIKRMASALPILPSAPRAGDKDNGGDFDRRFRVRSHGWRNAQATREQGRQHDPLTNDVPSPAFQNDLGQTATYDTREIITNGSRGRRHDEYRASADMTRRVVAVVFDDFLLLDLAGPLGALEVANYYLDHKYDVELVSAHGGPVRSSAGVVVQSAQFDEGATVDLMLVPGGPGATAAAPGALLALVREVAVHARRSACICSGAFLFAAAGLLDGRRATTHWAAAAILKRDYPQVNVDSDCIFIEDRDVWTSAGVTAGIDLTLALIEKDHGFAIARKAAESLVVYLRRPGGQQQFSAALELQSPDGRFGPLLEWARERLHEPLQVERLAERCGLSPRQFSRAFTEETGISPAKAIEKLRIDRARPEVSDGQESLDILARRHGFGTAAQLRRAFIRELGTAPQVLRRAATTAS